VLRAKVRRRKPGHVSVRYGTIRNPGLQVLSDRVVRVVGNPRNPRKIVLRTHRKYARGTVLSAPPGGKLPHGLLARITGVRSGSRLTTIGLRPASIYEVVPNMSFRTRLDISGAASSSAVACDGLSGVTPFVRISDVWADGAWVTSRVWPFGDVKTGARLSLDFDVGAGVQVAAAVGISCTVTFPGLTVQAFPAGIPVYGTIKPVLEGTVGAGGRLRAEGKVRINTGARIEAIPPRAEPTLSVGPPRFQFTNEVFAEIGLGFGIRSEIGLGASDGANLHVAAANNVEFKVGGGTCRWDLRLGTFSAGGKLGRWSVSTPSTPPLYERNLWQAPCVPPPLVAPLVRAQAAWNTDADVDLYAWDEAGHLLYFGEREGIPGAELIEDVIPDEGVTVHDPEIFRELSTLGRRYTFGLCLYRGTPTSVTLTVPHVPDPRGAPRTFPVNLDYEGDGAIVATSPEGPAYTPPPDWCRSVASLERRQGPSPAQDAKEFHTIR
jgi:hypothetical protein